MSDTINLQEAILKEVCRERVPVTMFLMNGFQLRVCFDDSGYAVHSDV